MSKTPEVQRYQRIDASRRRLVAAELLKRYESGRSVRQLCAETGYSIGRVRRLLELAGVTYRSRGGRHLCE